MRPITESFVQAETAYRHERVSASFRDHAAAPHRFRIRRTKGSAGTVTTPEPPAAA
jgi:hypothetical protein